MPEFVLEDSDHAARAETPFVLGFIEAMFFTESGCTESAEWFDAPDDERTSDGQLPSDTGYIDLHLDSLAAIRADCEAWQAANSELLRLAYATGYEEVQGGRDYWFTRNGHGVGFWDRKELNCPGSTGTGLSLGLSLYDACQYNEVNAYFGDDCLVHVTL